MRPRYRVRIYRQSSLTLFFMLSLFCCFVRIESRAREKDNRHWLMLSTPNTFMVTPSPAIRYRESRGNTRIRDYDLDTTLPTVSSYKKTSYTGRGNGSKKKPSFERAYKIPTTSKPVDDNEVGFCKRGRNTIVLCYCEPNGEFVETADCWVTTSNVTKNDSEWQIFVSHPNLQELKLSIQGNGYLDFIPTKVFQKYENLKNLKIEFINIHTLYENIFGTRRILENMQLTNNHIQVIESNAFSNYKELHEINLERNKIHTISQDAFHNLPACERIYLSYNKLNELLPDTFAEVTRLSYLDVSHNLIGDLKQNMFKGLGNLLVLRAGSNHITSLADGVFTELWTLDELDLENNQIEEISERAFDGLNNLRILNLRNNNIIELNNGVFRGTPALHVLKIENNGLETLSYYTFQPIMDNLVNETSEIAVENNNFVCDCRMQWLFELRNQTHYEPLVESLEEITCVIYNPSADIFVEPVPEDILNYIKYYNFKYGNTFKNKHKKQKNRQFNAMTDLELFGNFESVSTKKRRSLNDENVNQEVALTKDFYQDAFYHDDSQNLEHISDYNDMTLPTDGDNQLKSTPVATIRTTFSTHPHNETGIMIRYFMLKSDRMSCTTRNPADLTELPLSRDLMDREQYENKSPSYKPVNISMMKTLFFICIWFYFLTY